MSPSGRPGAGSTPAAVRVIGVGGAGVNAVSRLLDLGIPGVGCLAVDTSAQTLGRLPSAHRLALGHVSRGLGTGGQARLGAAAVWAAERPLRAALEGAHVVVVVAGLAGGTGGGAGPELARLARELGATTLGCGIRPFGFESLPRRRAAREAAVALRGAADCVFFVDNDEALRLAGDQVGLDVALRVADDRLRQAVQGLGSLLTGRGWIRVDVAHARSLLAGGGPACLALGVARGERPAEAAVAALLANPQTDLAALRRSRAVLLHVAGGSDLAVADVAAAVERLGRQLPAGCAPVVGASLDPALCGAAQVTVMGAATWSADAAGTGAELIPWPLGAPGRVDPARAERRTRA
jgi:cell division protein FtsZ